MAENYEKKLYLAYGSNLNLEQMARRCPGAKPVGTAKLEGMELLFRRGVATVEPDADSFVPVLVWELTPRDEEALDVYEGFPRLYVKVDFEVELNGEFVSGMVYVMNSGYEASPPSREYLRSIRQGYRSAGFDTSVLDAAVGHTIELMAAERQSFGGMGWGW
jgi:hypothetical protein